MRQHWEGTAWPREYLPAPQPCCGPC